jgi:hypothetical protein
MSVPDLRYVAAQIVMATKKAVDANDKAGHDGPKRS